MTRTEAAELLVLIAAYDNRTFDEVTAAAWATTLDTTTFVDAVEAVHRHYRHSPRWVMPAEVRKLAIDIGNDRATEKARQERKALEEAADPDGAAKVRQIIEQLAEATRLPEDSPHPKQSREDLQRARRVACPWCQAGIRQPCFNRATGERIGFTHYARLELARQPLEAS